MKLKEKVCIITGAGQGIGKYYAHRLAEEGAKVVIAEYNEETGKRVADEIRDKGYDLFFDTDDHNMMVMGYSPFKMDFDLLIKRVKKLKKNHDLFLVLDEATEFPNLTKSSFKLSHALTNVNPHCSKNVK